jgi:hypothetical protein
MATIEPLWFLGPLAGLASGPLNRYGFGNIKFFRSNSIADKILA